MISGIIHFISLIYIFNTRNSQYKSGKPWFICFFHLEVCLDTVSMGKTKGPSSILFRDTKPSDAGWWRELLKWGKMHLLNMHIADNYQLVCPVKPRMKSCCLIFCREIFTMSFHQNDSKDIILRSSHWIRLNFGCKE